jgi:hypothetical protein
VKPARARSSPPSAEANVRPSSSLSKTSMRRSASFRRSWHSRDSFTPCSNSSRLFSSGRSPRSNSRTIRSNAASDASNVCACAPFFFIFIS